MMLFLILIYIHVVFLQLLIHRIVTEHVVGEETKVIPQVDFSSKLYIDWRDEINYHKECQQLKRALNSNKQRVLSHSGYPGGLGHKYISLSHSILYSTLSDNTLQIDIPSGFWNATYNCLHNSEMTLEKATIPATVFNGRYCSNITSMTEFITTLKTFNHSALLDCRVPFDKIESKYTRNELQSKHLIKEDETVSYFYKKVLRILLNPSPSILSNVQDFMSYHFRDKRVLGIQIRTGGCVANFHEMKSMMSLKEIRQFPSYINNIMEKESLLPARTTIFLSTDSDLVEQYIREQLRSNIEIITANTYQRSHSRGKANDESIYGALMDILLLAKADVLITCSGSGFGRVANIISLSSKKYIYNTTHTTAELYSKNLRKCIEVPIL